MTHSIKVIKMGRAAGKTTKALQLLEAQGGGVFITANPRQAMMLVKNLELKRVTILSVQMYIGANIVIDDADQLDVTLVATNPLELRET